MTLTVCTLYQGLPHGLAIITYKDPDFKYLSFKGVGVFYQGTLHNTPLTWVEDSGWGGLVSNMQNGRPAPKSYET